MAVLSRRLEGFALNPDSAVWHLTWFAAISAVAFLLPFTLTSVLDLHHDVYYFVYFTATLLLLRAYVNASGIDILARLRSRWQASLAIGVVVSAFVVWSVLARIDSTPHPDGLYFAFEILWRGAVYGFVDALLLSAFPGLIAFALMREDIGGIARRAAYSGLTLALVVLITGVYHWGYEDFRDGDIIQPETGNTIISLPVVLTANPLGSLVAQTSMHLAAVTHAYESDDRLPPQTYVSDSPREAQLSDGDDGETVELARGGKLIIALTSNPSTGFGWYVGEGAGRGLELLGEPRFVPAGSTGPVVGAPGTQVFSFEATERGASQMVLEYRRSFEPTVPAEKTFHVTVEVR
jgi:predicted secreted protein